MTIDEAKEEIKRRVNMRDFAISHGIKHYSGGLYHSPFRTDKNPSFGIKEKGGRWFWRDFSDSAPEPRAGDVITYVELLRGCSFIESVKWLASYCGIEITGGGGNGSPVHPAGARPLKLKNRPPAYIPVQTESELFHKYRAAFKNQGAGDQEADTRAILEVRNAVYSDIITYCAGAEYSERVKDYLERERAISITTAEKFLLFDVTDIRGLQTELTGKYKPADLILSGVTSPPGDYWNIERGRLYIPYNTAGKFTHLKGRFIPQTPRPGTPVISYFQRISKPKEITPVPFDQAINSIRTGIYKTPRGTIDIRPVVKEIQTLTMEAARAVNENEKKEIKERTRVIKRDQLPGFVFSGQFTERETTALKRYEGIFTVDIDNIEGDINAVKDQINRDPYTFVSFISPSGRGLKILVKIPLLGDNIERVEKHHKAAFTALNEYYNFGYGLNIDGQCNDLVRCCFGSYDPGIFVNEGAALFQSFIPKYKQIGDGRAGLKFFNYDAITEAAPGTDVYLTAGEFDAIILTQIGFTAVSLFKDSETIPPAVLTALKPFTVKIIIDNDASGNSRAAQVMETLTGAGIRAARVQLKPGTDVNSFINGKIKGTL